MEPTDALSTIVDLALREDLGPGDWTTLWTVPAERRVTARIVAKAPGVIAGVAVAEAILARVDPDLRVEFLVRDGDPVGPGASVTRIEGSARSILMAERVALNFLQRLSGVATVTRQFVLAVEGTGTRILDTRKTTPGMRWLEKDAVVSGGGVNHRFGLHDMVLIKENHIRAAGGITRAVRAVAEHNRQNLRVEVEATTPEEVREALAAGIDRILLDNMDLDTLRRCVQLVWNSRTSTETEASGGVSLATVREIAETGVDFVSVGALTHSAPALDLSLLVDLDADA
jgi:nicotinate-nucleotide pyrophosphorylase (carboxylating)